MLPVRPRATFGWRCLPKLPARLGQRVPHGEFHAHGFHGERFHHHCFRGGLVVVPAFGGLSLGAGLGWPYYSYPDESYYGYGPMPSTGTATTQRAITPTCSNATPVGGWFPPIDVITKRDGHRLPAILEGRDGWSRCYRNYDTSGSACLQTVSGGDVRRSTPERRLPWRTG
jgi:hypothetical protein